MLRAFAPCVARVPGQRFCACPVHLYAVLSQGCQGLAGLKLASCQGGVHGGQQCLGNLAVAGGVPVRVLAPEVRVVKFIGRVNQRDRQSGDCACRSSLRAASLRPSSV